MKRFIVVFFVFLFALAGVSFSSFGNAGNNVTPTNAVKTNSEQSSYTYDEYIYVRVLIDGHWWTYVYTSDGSFIVAIPDEDD